VEVLVDRIVEGLQDKDDDDNRGERSGETPIKPNDIPSDVGENEESENEVLSPARVGTLEESRDRNVRTTDSSTMPETQVNPSFCNTPKVDGSADDNSHRCTRAMSCPPTANRHALPGPWSWEWLHDHNDGAAGVIFSASKKAKHGGDQKGGYPGMNHKKAGGVLRHRVHSLKKIARLPTKDRGEVLKVLGKCARRRKGADHAASTESSASGSTNNDWKNWVTVHGNDQMDVDDVWGIGQAIGVMLRGDKENMFHVLSRTGKGKQEKSRHLNGEGARKEKSC
jgi:hypothetical protein